MTKISNCCPQGTVFRELSGADSDACSSRGRWRHAWPHLGAKADIWQEEVHCVKYPPCAMPDAVEAHPAHSDVGVCTAGRGCPLLNCLQYMHVKLLMQTNYKELTDFCTGPQQDLGAVAMLPCVMAVPSQAVLLQRHQWRDGSMKSGMRGPRFLLVPITCTVHPHGQPHH